MECSVCKGKSFYKHSGNLVCNNCNTQACAELKNDDFTLTPTHLKRKLVLNLKKEAKNRQNRKF